MFEYIFLFMLIALSSKSSSYYEFHNTKGTHISYALGPPLSKTGPSGMVWYGVGYKEWQVTGNTHKQIRDTQLMSIFFLMSTSIEYYCFEIQCRLRSRQLDTLWHRWRFNTEPIISSDYWPVENTLNYLLFHDPT